MRNNKIHTPEGVRDFLPDELKFKINAERKIEEIFIQYNYPLISSPMYEYAEVFEGKGSVSASQIYKFLDRDGMTLALRSDMTPAISRIAATAYSKDDMPLRFGYFTNTFRNNVSYQGKLKEITQAGIELIGVNSDDAVAEVIAVAIKSILATGLTEFRIAVGSVKFLKAILDDSNFNSDECDELQKLIAYKDFVAAEKMVNGSGINDGLKNLFRELPFLTGGHEILAKARNIVNNSKAMAALEQLENIYDILKDYGLSEYVFYDLSMIGYLGYYTGIIFNGYAYGAASSILNGGQYDTLMSKFGADYPAVGFAIKMDILLQAMEAISVEYKASKADTMIVYSKEGRAAALSIADELRRTGVNIENGFETADIEKIKEYARRKNFGGILYFADNNYVKAIDLIKSEVNTIEIGNIFEK